MFKSGDLVKIKNNVDMKSWDQNFVKWYESYPDMTFVVNKTSSFYVVVSASFGSPPYPYDNNISLFSDKVELSSIAPPSPIQSSPAKVDWLKSIREASGK
jgi:hypothetical protein